MLLSMLPNEAEVVEDAARLGFAWQGLAEIEPRQISTLTDICGRLTELLYVWLASGSDIDWKPTNSIAEACISIGQIVWPVLHPPNRDWPSPSKMLPGTFPHLISVISKTIWNCPDEGHLFLVTCSTSSAEPSLRGCALGALSRHFRDDPQTKALVRARAVEETDGRHRRAALQALAEHFRDDPQTKALLRARAVEDPDGRCRGAALFGFAQTLAVRELAVLASQYLDGLTPGRDPRKPVTFDDIARAVVSLSKSEEEIRALYQRLSAEVPLTFADND